MNHIVEGVCQALESRTVEAVCPVFKLPHPIRERSNWFLFNFRVKYFLDSGKWELYTDGENLYPNAFLYIDLYKIDVQLPEGYILNTREKIENLNGKAFQLSRNCNSNSGETTLYLKIKVSSIPKLLPNSTLLLKKYEFFI